MIHFEENYVNFQKNNSQQYFTGSVIILKDNPNKKTYEENTCNTLCLHYN